ncbi:uncharacterized protein BDZ99DRAFT_463900 [Mytilinidion resinicola]|uniref:Uncharacterized protein n=1 Tax=Mytilinidion resinicola TaxID=574789 RepID=A0A6A6YJU3_9PEZI|nr:uncharacterized protein BDZ99DRAFT_463900 [Mytilinidion resinicola]KAF2809081.1 hypothetical protein BDZ99DRAFT_463900 [Mytilinidion resinicola]
MHPLKPPLEPPQLASPFTYCSLSPRLRLQHVKQQHPWFLIQCQTRSLTTLLEMLCLGDQDFPLDLLNKLRDFLTWLDTTNSPHLQRNLTTVESRFYKVPLPFRQQFAELVWAVEASNGQTSISIVNDLYWSMSSLWDTTASQSSAVNIATARYAGIHPSIREAFATFLGGMVDVHGRDGRKFIPPEGDPESHLCIIGSYCPDYTAATGDMEYACAPGSLSTDLVGAKLG